MSKFDSSSQTYSRSCGAACAIATEVLQSHPMVAWHTNDTGYVPVLLFKQLVESIIGAPFTDELVEKFKKTQSIEFHSSGEYVRAAFGHGGYVIARMLQLSHTLYTGPQKVFCISHTSVDGLGAINAGRKTSMLVPPEFCFNRGVRAYVNIDTLARNGIPVWHQNGDRQTKVFCFSPDLRNFTYGLEYTDEYFKDENLARVHAKIYDSLRQFHQTLPEPAFKTFVMDRIKRLVIHEDDEEDVA